VFHAKDKVIFVTYVIVADIENQNVVFTNLGITTTRLVLTEIFHVMTVRSCL